MGKYFTHGSRSFGIVLLIGSIIAELIGMPILFFWLGKVVDEKNENEAA